MKLDFLGDISDGDKFPHVVSDNLFRLYNFDKDETNKFSKIVNETILKAKISFDMTLSI
jgi:hypothetical protein